MAPRLAYLLITRQMTMNSITQLQDGTYAKEPGTHTGYDYIIVGAGSGGCVVARRLADHTDARILVLEAGGRHPHDR